MSDLKSILDQKIKDGFIHTDLTQREFDFLLTTYKSPEGYNGDYILNKTRYELFRRTYVKFKKGG